jgi:hypothetical protein
MKRSKFSDEQILAIVRERAAGRRLPTWFARTASPSTYYRIKSRISHHPCSRSEGRSIAQFFGPAV